MADFSQRDLLILSNYVYFACSTYDVDACLLDTVNRFKNEKGEYDLEKLRGQGAISCNISDEEAIDLFKRIEGDEKLRSLHIARKLENKDIRAVCFATEDESDACVIFRGTGGSYDAWYDNVTGEYEKDTKLQKVAADFIRNDCSAFNNITVSGHSKGGNLAQYVTVVCGDKISDCVSFDGQGFSKSFLMEYKKEINNARDKITSISAYNDYVNILLAAIASKRIFLKNTGKDIDGHSSATLLNSIEFSADGSIDLKKSATLQGLPAWFLEKTSDNMVDIIDMLPGDGAKKASNIIASAVAAFMSNDMGEEYEKRQFSEAIRTFGSYASNIYDLVILNEKRVNIMYSTSYVRCEGIKKAADTMSQTCSDVSLIIENVEDIRKNIDYVIAGRQYTDYALNKIIDNLISIRKKIILHSETIRKANNIYSIDERELLNNISSILG